MRGKNLYLIKFAFHLGETLRNNIEKSFTRQRFERGRLAVRRSGVSAFRRFGASAVRRFGGSSFQRIGASAFRRFGGSMFQRLGGWAYRGFGGSAVPRFGGSAVQPPTTCSRGRHCLSPGEPRLPGHALPAHHASVAVPGDPAVRFGTRSRGRERQLVAPRVE